MAQAADVRDMLCAQALAVVSDAVARLAVGESLVVQFNAEDVRRDLEAWASDRGHSLRLDDPVHLTLQRGH